MNATNKLVLVGSLALLCVPVAASAQNATSGAIQGVVRDSGTGESLAGVTVAVSSDKAQGTQTAITGASGSFKITNLPPGTYTVKFYYLKLEIQVTGIVVSLNKVTPVYRKIDSSKATESEKIIVKGKAPTIDPTSTAQGITLGQEYTKNIPVPGRTYASTLGAAPGAANDDLGVSFSGSTSLENSYVVDGVNTTGLTFGSVGTGLINDFIEEIEIITGGYNAEYGRATGGVVNVVTKSGSNEFHGSVFSTISPGFLIADFVRTPSQGTSIDVETNLAYNWDFGFDLGGPIVKDKVWFYVGFSPRLVRTNIDKITKRRTDCRVEQEDGTLSPCEMPLGDGMADEDPDTGLLIFDELDTERRHSDATSYQVVSKVNFALAPEHQGQFTFIGTPFSGQQVGVRGAPSATQFDFTSLTTDIAAKWTSKFNDNKTELEAVLGWHRSAVEADSIDNSANDVPRQVLLFGTLGTWSNFGFETDKTREGCRDGAAFNDPYLLIDNCPDEGLIGYSVGGPGGIVDEKEERLSARLSATQRVKALGTHEIKGGVDVESNRLTDVRDISGGIFYRVFLANDIRSVNETRAIRWVKLGGSDNPDGFRETCTDDRDLGVDRTFPCEYLDVDTVEGRTLNWSAYLRDSWQIVPNLTLNYGLRYEEQRLRHAKGLQNTTDALTGNALGTNAMKIRNMWAPRFGAVYDWTKEGRSKVYGHWGRFYESIPMDINNRSFGGETLFEQRYDANNQCGATDPNIGGPSGPSCTERGEVPAAGERIFGGGVLVAPGVKGQFMDEYILGVEYEVVEDLKVGVSFQNRSMGRVLEDVSLDGGDTYILANPGDWSASDEAAFQSRVDAEMDPEEKARLADQLENFKKIRIFDKPRRDYNALQITATKRFSRQLFVQGSYTYSRTRGNYPGLFSSDNGQIDPNITSQFDLIELLANRDGPLPIDHPHDFKVDGYYVWDFKKAGQMVTGMRFRAFSGVPKSALGAHFRYGFNESFVLPRGAMGRNGFDLRLDLHLAYSRKLGKGMELELFTDLFSVTNRQDVAQVDATYTLDDANPIVGGEFEDLVFLKRQTRVGGESADPVRRWRNFQNPVSRYRPFSARVGARLTF